jgi:broad specificity phosphatase PhoE
MTRIIMIRHGQSLANAQSRFAGHSDFDLSELGKQQAELAAKYLCEKEQIDVIYSSDLLRAHNTALPFSKAYGLPINDREGLRELFAGDWEGRTIDDIKQRYAEDFRVWREDFSNARCTGGESVGEMYERMIREVLCLARENDGKCILLATHATPIRVTEAYSRGLSADRVHEVPFVRNSAMNIFEYDGNTLRPVKTNITEHLDDALQSDVPKGLIDLKR